MLTTEKINELLSITESYQAPARMLELMLDNEKRAHTFNEFLEVEWRLGYEWFQSYFENEHSDRKVKKQDFTPNSVSQLLTRLTQDTRIYFEATAGTGGILIQHWHNQRMQISPIRYDPREFWYQVEELSDRAVPFLIFNMSIRGMNGVVLHGDSLERTFKDVYFIRNDSADHMAYSEVIKMERTDHLMRELAIQNWI